jgi:hypothetical protein
MTAPWQSRPEREVCPGEETSHRSIHWRPPQAGSSIRTAPHAPDRVLLEVVERPVVRNLMRCPGPNSIVRTSRLKGCGHLGLGDRHACPRGFSYLVPTPSSRSMLRTSHRAGGSGKPIGGSAGVVKAGRRPPGGLGLNGEDTATLGEGSFGRQQRRQEERIVVEHGRVRHHHTISSVEQMTRWNARILAQLLAADFLPRVWLPDERTRGLRRQVTRRRIWCANGPGAKTRSMRSWRATSPRRRRITNGN